MYALAAVLLSSAVILGGATTSGYIADVTLQLISIPCLLAATWAWVDDISATQRELGGVKAAFTENITTLGPLALFFILLVGLVVSQLTPVLGGPEIDGLLERLNVNGAVAEAGQLYTGTKSLSPAMSAAALAAILPTLAIFLLVSRLNLQQRVRLTGLFSVLGLASLALGIIQVVQGPHNSIRFQDFANTAEATGFFANRNHFAALLYSALLLGIAWFTASGRLERGARRKSRRQVLWIAALFSFLVLILAGIALARSRAGILLTVAALVATVIASPGVYVMATGAKQSRSRLRMLSLATALLLALGIGQMGSDRFLGRFHEGVSDSIRSTLREVTGQAVMGALPSGTGLATFPEVYAVYEPTSTLDSATFINRAHNDWLEFILETGILGIGLILCFLAWFTMRSVQVWTQPSAGPSGPAGPTICADNALNQEDTARAHVGAIGTRSGQEPMAARILAQFSSMAIILLMIHSYADYPLRTATLGVCFAMCCGLLCPLPKGVQPNRGFARGTADMAYSEP